MSIISWLETRPNLRELLISSRMTMSYSPDSRAFAEASIALRVSSPSLASSTGVPSMWSSPIGTISKFRSIAAAFCSPYPPSGFRNCIMIVFRPSPDALMARPNAAVVFPLPLPV